MTSSTRHTRRVLLIEDDDELRDALADALLEHGLHVCAVGDGRAGLTAMRTDRPDVVVLDLMMPTMSGWEFRLEQRRDADLADTPVIAISASHSPAASAVDAALYLQKPIEVKTLVDAIEDVLRTRERWLEPARLAEAERLAAVETLATGLSHEISNPLADVFLNLGHLVRAVPRIKTPQNASQVDEIAAFVRDALAGAERIGRITRGIRTFTAADDATTEPVDVAVVLEASLKLVMRDLRDRAQLKRNCREAPLVLANKGRLAQVFLNLLDNAVQSLPVGGASWNEIKVSTGTDGRGRAFVEVADSGRGIPEHLLARIFEPFFSTRPIGEGTGLGLSISHGIVTALGGEIFISSETGQGTKARVALPPAALPQGV